MQSHGQQFVWLSRDSKVWEGRPKVIKVYFTLEKGKWA